MIRTATLAFVAAAILAAPTAFAETTAQVKLEGRTQAQIKADVKTIATKLCKEKVNAEEVDDCVADSVQATMKRIVARGDYVWTTSSAD